MNRRLRTRHLLPLGVLVLFSLLNLVSEPGQVVVGLLAMAPLVAATVLGRRATAAYGVAALLLAVFFGFYGDQYSAGTVVAQSIRLMGVALGGVLALFACTLRLRREEVLTRLSAEAAMARGAVQVAETLQRSLLTDPPAVPGLAIAVRYLPAVQHAQVGGDWYDAFPVPGGSTMLVIGDVAGHDVAAAATMAQARGVLRGIGTTVAGSPALVLGALDRAMAQLQVHTLITAAVATVHPPTAESGPRLDWSNAGHPPPVLLSADGRVQLLDRTPDLLLGVAAGVQRAEHHLTLAHGDTLVLYTDGLVERRGVPLDAGTSWLTERLAGLAGLPLEELCDELIAGMSGRLDDDVAVLAVRVC
ncbi:PP2C family protein-serine/threonine phosphatase [Modestobacter lacusdianchii]